MGLVASWVIPLILHLGGLDLLVMPLLLVGIASVLRSGEGLLDRLVFAGVTLVGATLTAGLLFSVWPWGLDPVPVGGSLLSLLVAIAFAAGRRPTLPRTVRWSDGVILGTGIAAGLAAARPIMSLSLTNRLTYSTTSLDRLAHFALYDSIQKIGGYTFLNQVQARHFVQTPTEVVYPQGSHFLLALLNSFARAGAGPAPGPVDYNRYFIFVIAGFALLSMGVVWAARWIAGPDVHEGAHVVTCLVVSVFTLFGPLIYLINFGFDAELFGLIFVTVGTAIAVRPALAAREQIIFASAVTVATFYTYNLFGAITTCALFLSLMLHRFPLRREWKFAAAVIIPAVAVAAFPSALSLAHGFNAGSQALIVGTVVPMPNELIPVIAGLVLLCLVAPSVRREGLWRGVVAQAIPVAAVVGAFGEYQIRSLGHTTLYFSKFELAAYVASIACLGLLAVVLGSRRSAGQVETAQRYPGAARLVIAATAMVVIAWFGAVQQNASQIVRGTVALHPHPPLRQWESGLLRSRLAPMIVSLERHGLLADGVPTVVDYLPTLNDDWRVTFFLASFNRNLGLMQPALADIREGSVTAGRSARKLDALVRAIADTHSPVRVILRDPALAQALNDRLRTEPDLHPMVLVLPTL